MPNLPVDVTMRILAECRQGRTFQAIAVGLMDDGNLTSRGRKLWFPATVKAVVDSDNAATLK